MNNPVKICTRCKQTEISLEESWCRSCWQLHGLAVSRKPEVKAYRKAYAVQNKSSIKRNALQVRTANREFLNSLKCEVLNDEG